MSTISGTGGAGSPYQTAGINPLADTQVPASASAPASQPGATSAGGNVPGVASNATTGTSGTSSTDATLSSQSGEDTFLQLLVAQMKNQDPDQPMDSTSFVTELAQFNSVEQMITLNQSVQAQTTSGQAAEGVSLIGKSVTYTDASSGTSMSAQGTVTGVSITKGTVQLQLGSKSVNLSDVTGVAAASTAGATAGSGTGTGNGQTAQGGTDTTASGGSPQKSS